MKTFVERTVTRLVRTAGCLVLAGTMMATLPTAFAQQGNQQEEGQQEQMAASFDEVMARARQLEEAGRWPDAADAYAQAMEMRPDSEEARDGYQRAQAMLNQAETITEVEREFEIQRERARREYDQSMERAQNLLDEQSFDQARNVLLIAQTRLDAARPYLGPGDYEQKSADIDDMLERVRDERIAFEAAEEERIRQEAITAKEREQARERRERQRLINENLLRVRQLQMEMKYDEALQVINEILFLDPLNPAALTLKDMITQARLLVDFRRTTQRKNEGFANLRLEAQDAMIPPRRNVDGPGMRSTTGVMQYPEDWPQLSQIRGNDSGFQESPQNRRVYQTLNDTRVPIDFQNNTFEQVVNYLQNVTGVQIYVDWKALDFIGITRDEEVDLQLGEITAQAALDRVLAQVGDEFEKPDWTVEDGILTVSSDDALRKRTVTIVYDIRDLLFEVPYFDNAPELDLDSALNQGGNVGGGGGGGGGFGGGGGGFGGGGGGGGGGGAGGGSGGSIFGDPGDDPDRLSREELVAQIVNIIQENIDPEGWRDLGGDTGSLQELNGNLIITNTPGNHRDIEGLLAQLREIRALQINVESRFLEVNTDWFEQIGVDLDLYFNTNNTAFQQARQVDPNFILSDFFDPQTGQRKETVFWDTIDQTLPQGNTVNTGRSIYLPVDSDGDGLVDTTGVSTLFTGTPVRTTEGFAPIGVSQGSVPITEAIGDLTDFGSSVLGQNPALSVGIQFLDDVQVDLLIEATQADRRSVVLTAPRLTFFNGQRSWVAVTTTQAFVSGLTAVTGDDSGAFQPQIGQLREGFVLDVEGVVSADRRYVTMTVIASLAQNAEFRETDAAEFGGAAGGGSDDGGDAGAAGEFTGRIELPQITASLVQTTVSVPDKGTILLGGQRAVQEIEVESGVPILSKIPFINRFFTNRITTKEENTLLILIRPEIIIQQENEDLLFPGLSDSLGGSAYMR